MAVPALTDTRVIVLKTASPAAGSSSPFDRTGGFGVSWPMLNIADLGRPAGIAR